MVGKGCSAYPLKAVVTKMEGKMPGLTIEDAKKDMEKLVEKARKEYEAGLPEDKKKLLEQTRKAEEEARKKQEEQQKKDAELLEREIKEPDKLSEDDKKRVVVVKEEKVKAEEAKLSGEEKLKRTQDSMQRRIDELSNELKQNKELTAKEIKTHQKELQLLRQENENLKDRFSQPEKPDTTAVLRQKEQERLTKYLQEDAGLLKEQKREMSEEEFEEWYAEQPARAQRWLTQQELRRARERAKDQEDLDKDNYRKDFERKIDESQARVLIRHPELDITKREAELKGQGKSSAEIRSIICQENEKFRIAAEIVRENPDYFTKANAPELIAVEMERRLAVKSSQPAETAEQKEIKALRKKLEDLEAEVAGREITDQGVNSTVVNQNANQEGYTPQEAQIVDLMTSAGASKKEIDLALKIHHEKKNKK